MFRVFKGAAQSFALIRRLYFQNAHKEGVKTQNNANNNKLIHKGQVSRKG